MSPNGSGGELKERAYGIGRPVLSLEDIKNIKVPLASYDKQQEIIRKVEKLLGNAEGSNESLNLEVKFEEL